MLFAALAVAHGLAAPAARAHEDHGAHATPQASLLSRWTFDGWTIALLMASAALFAAGVARVWGRAGRGRGILLREVAGFGAAWIVLVITLLSPLDHLSDLLFSAHMSQHELLMLVAAPLMVLGRPLFAYLWALPASWRVRVGAWVRSAAVQVPWRMITGPLFVLVLHGVVRWVWHVPALYEAALADERVHAVQHATFFGSAALFWWALLHGRYGRSGYPVGVLFVFATALHSGLLGALITFATRTWYPTYDLRAPLVGMEPLEDQQLAGLIMWVPAGVLFLLIALTLFVAWLGEAERVVRSHSWRAES
jgi:putative membrane protein